MPLHPQLWYSKSTLLSSFISWDTSVKVNVSLCPNALPGGTIRKEKASSMLISFLLLTAFRIMAQFPGSSNGDQLDLLFFIIADLISLHTHAFVRLLYFHSLQSSSSAMLILPLLQPFGTSSGLLLSRVWAKTSHPNIPFGRLVSGKIYKLKTHLEWLSPSQDFMCTNLGEWEAS